MVLSSTNQYYHVDGALSGMQSATPLQVKNVAVLVHNPYNNDKIICIISQVLYDSNPNQHEALLQPHQYRSYGTAINDCAVFCYDTNGNPGTQCIRVPDHKINLLHDGWKAYLLITKPTMDDFEKYDVVELTSPSPYNPSH